MRLLGVPIESPAAVVNRILSDLGAVSRAARVAPAQINRMLELGEEIATIGRSVLEIAERLDARAEAVLAIGQRLDERAEALLELGTRIETLGAQVDSRGAEIVHSASQVAETGSELIGVLPALERALQMASPLEGAIDRFGRLVDRLPGGAPRRNVDEPDPTAVRSIPGRGPAAS
jgi:methyl-accepting chemotaxis protein